MPRDLAVAGHDGSLEETVSEKVWTVVWLHLLLISLEDVAGVRVDSWRSWP